ncbi:unnamed protein product [Closterium sp. Yama58-4]|nr:unnamed protein product [Closterium sp. Yama58-4]
MAATGNLRIGEGLQLLLYALYKQASDGPCDAKQPAVYNFKARAKWDAWKKLGSMSQDEAMAQYVGLVEQMIPNPNEVRGMGSRLHALASADVEDTSAVEEWIKQHPEALEQRDDEGRTALHWAADRGKLTMTRCLLAHGADVNQTDDEGQTPLHYATVCEHESIADLLLENGADPCHPDNEGTRPKHIRPASWSAPAWTGLRSIRLPDFQALITSTSMAASLLVALLLASASLGQQRLVAAKPNIAESQADGLAVLQMAWGELEPSWAVGSDCSKALGLSCDDQGRIVAINLPAGNISGYLPEGISTLKSLQQISLPSNQLFNSLPLSVSLLTNLTSIELSNNNITGSIPPAWFQLRDLNILDLSRNRLTSSLPDAFDPLASLHLLNLSSNSFSGNLPPSIGNLNFLEKLDLHSNPFSGTLPAALAQLSSLTLLDVSATGLLCPLGEGTCPSYTVSMSSLYCDMCASYCRYCNDPSIDHTPLAPTPAPAPNSPTTGGKSPPPSPASTPAPTAPPPLPNPSLQSPPPPATTPPSTSPPSPPPPSRSAFSAHIHSPPALLFRLSLLAMALLLPVPLL